LLWICVDPGLRSEVGVVSIEEMCPVRRVVLCCFRLLRFLQSNGIFLSAYPGTSSIFPAPDGTPLADTGVFIGGAEEIAHG
jgi:hypothetical protein